MRQQYFAALAVIAIPCTVSAQQADFPNEARLTQRTRALADAARATMNQLTIVSEEEIALRDSQRQVTVFKVVNNTTNRFERYVLDENQTPVVHADLLEAERAKRRERFGVMQAALYRQLQGANPAARIPVLIKFNVNHQRVDRDNLPAVADRAGRARLLDQARQFRATAEADVNAIATVLFDGLGPAEIERRDQFGPFLAARLRPQVIERVARDPNVVFIGLDEEPIQVDWVANAAPPSIPASLALTATDQVHDLGVHGADVTIAIMEPGKIEHPDCFNITKDGLAAESGIVYTHIATSLGMVGNTWLDGTCKGPPEGYAPKATLVAANDGTYELFNYRDNCKWALDNEADIISMSWHFPSELESGDMHSRDVFFDHVVGTYPFPVVVTSAGDITLEDNDFAAGKGYNMISVADVVNAGDNDRNHASIVDVSAWRNPWTTHGDREVPVIAAPGSRHSLLGMDYGGTSAATPVAASLAGLILSHEPSLKDAPEAVRAVMMAAANYQYSDDALWSPDLDGADGVGLLHALNGHYTAGRRQGACVTGGECEPQYRAHDHGTLKSEQFVDGWLPGYWSAYTTTTDCRIRVALAWRSKTDGESSVLDADLDLVIYGPSGGPVAWSTSWDGSYEFAEFEPAEVGEYRIRIGSASEPGSAAFDTAFGLAWLTHYDTGS